MKSLKQIREAKSGGKEAYQKFFNSLLKKFGVSSPSELEGDQKKKFYDELDAGWESDDPNDKNERYEDPEGLDPETTHDSDEDMADKAASQVNASYGKMNAGYIKSAYHKEDVSHPKPLSIIRSNKLSSDALEEAYDMNEKMVMCEQCGKMHEEGACGESYDSNSLDPETKGMKENKMLGNMDTALASLSKKPEYKKISKNLMSLSKRAAERDKGAPKQLRTQLASLASKVDKKAGAALMKMSKLAGTYESVEEGLNESEIQIKDIPKSQWAVIKKKYNIKIDSDSTGTWAAGKPNDLYKWAMDRKGLGMSKNDVKKTYNHITPEYKGASNIKNKQREEVEEAMSMRSIGLKGASKRSRETGRKAKEGPALKGAKLGKSQPVLNRSQENEIHKIAKKHSGDMEKAMKEIGKMRVWKGKGIQDHPYVMDVLKKANETYDYGSDKAVKAAKKKTPGQKNEGVAVDRRTKGFKDAMIRNEKAKKVREKAKKKKEAKKDQAELDARYDYDGEVDSIISAASKVMMGTNETAANAVAHGGVDMAPNAGKKKKDKEKLMAQKRLLMKSFKMFESDAYHSGLSKSSKAKRQAQFKKQAAMDDDDPNAYKPAVGDKTAKTRKSTHTTKMRKDVS